MMPRMSPHPTHSSLTFLHTSGRKHQLKWIRFPRSKHQKTPQSKHSKLKRIHLLLKVRDPAMVLFPFVVEPITLSFVGNTDLQTKPAEPSPTRSISSEPLKKTVTRDASPLPVPPATPPSPAPAVSSTVEEPTTPKALPPTLNSASHSHSTTPGRVQ